MKRRPLGAPPRRRRRIEVRAAPASRPRRYQVWLANVPTLTFQGRSHADGRGRPPARVSPQPCPREPPPMPEPLILSWSGGKDSMRALDALRASGRYDPIVLLTSVTAGYERISIHGVRRELLSAQAAALGLPLHEFELQPETTNAAYEAALAAALSEVRGHTGARRVAFGDLFLQDVRRYREEQVAALGFEPIF